MKILVTGGAGFIGSNLTEELIKEGHDVSVLDNFHTGSEKNLEPVKEKINIFRASCNDIGSLKLPGFEAIYHFGIPSSSLMYKEDPFLIGNAINGFMNILEYARRNESRIVFASSSSIYSGLSPPHNEGMKINVTDYYTEARLAMERLAELYNTLYDVKTIGLRFFSVYGKNEESKGKYANIVSQFLWAMQRGERPVIYGDGGQTRDYIFIKDVVNAAIMSMESKMGSTILNVGTGKNTTTNQAVELLNRVLGKNIKPEYVENPIKNYVLHTMADCSRINESLGFKAEYSLENGIREIVSEYPSK